MIEDLLRRLAEGDEGALKELYELTGRRVWSYIWRLCGDREMVDELTVMTYTEVWRSAPGFRGESKALTWIYAIARRLTYRALRGRRMEEDPEEGENSPVSEEDPFRECLRMEIRALVRKALEALPLKHREVLDLVFLHGLTYDPSLTVGRGWGISSEHFRPEITPKCPSNSLLPPTTHPLSLQMLCYAYKITS